MRKGLLLLALSAGAALSMPAPHPAAGPPSAAAQAYLDNAIAILRQNHINSDKADWAQLIAQAHAEIAGAQKPDDTYPAIRHLVAELGEKHSFFKPPPTQAEVDAAKKAGPTGVTPGTEMPIGTLLDGRVGVVRLPGLDTIGPGGPARGQAYSAALRTALQTFDKAALCGWIVDLRDDTGGNMWPMLAGLDPLLGPAPFGFFVAKGDVRVPWTRTLGGIVPSPMQVAAPPAFALNQAAAPVAILIGPKTASSGEMTALALIGRPKTRTFGSDSGGFLSANVPIPLSDGAHLVVTESLVADRMGKVYSGTIQPDTAAGAEGAEEAAKGWIEGQCPK